MQSENLLWQGKPSHLLNLINLQKLIQGLVGR